MWNEMLQDATPSEMAMMLGFILAMGFALNIPFVFVFGRTIALKKRPDERAMWTASLAYLGAAMLFVFMGGELIPVWLAPIVPLPGALIIYFWLRNTYRKGWVEDDQIVEGMSIENDDWRVGIGVIIAALVAAAIKVLFVQS